MAEVILVCVSKSPVDGSVRVLLQKHPGGDGLPAVEADPGLGCYGSAARLLKDVTGVSAGWAQLHQLPVVDLIFDVDTKGPRPILAVPYVCLLPEAVSEVPDDCRWVDFAVAAEAKLVEDHSVVLSKCVSGI